MFAAKKQELHTAPRPVPTKKPERVSRERLKHVHAELAKAGEAIESLEETTKRLSGIILEADQASKLLQAAIAKDGGKSLVRYSSGEAIPVSESDIVSLVTHERTSAEAAAAAKIALPVAEAALENAKAQYVVLVEQKNTELNRVLAALADDEIGRRYYETFNAACRLHDELVGYSEVAQSTIGDLRLTTVFPTMPRFVLPSMGNSDSDPFIRHQTSELTVTTSARKWAAIKAKLEADVNADISNLI
jgi:hypothetical protein